MTRCPYCFTELNGSEVCPHCGIKIADYHETEGQLPLFTEVNGYITGAVAERDKYRIEYIGFDKNNGSLCRIHEFFPQGVPARENDGVTVSGSANNSEEYKFAYRQFKERAQVLKKYSDMEAIVKIRDTFQANNTAYYISDVIEGQTLREYVSEPISAVETFKLMKPVIAALSALHSEGIIHRGITPDTVIRKDDGQLILTGFDTARDYLSRSELTVMLKQGFSAPEQYGKEGQGPWTDVYGICAAIYWLITWKTPADFFERMEDPDALTELSSMASGITAEQNIAVMTGLRINAKERWKDMGEFEKALYVGIKSVTVPPEEKAAVPSPAAQEKKIPAAAFIAGGAVLLLIILILLLK